MTTQQTYQKLDHLAERAHFAVKRTRTIYWIGAIIWTTALEIWSSIATLPVATLIPVSFPIFVWIKRRVELSQHYQIWSEARLAAEIARVIGVYEACGKNSISLCERLEERLREYQANPPTVVLRMLRKGKMSISSSISTCASSDRIKNSMPYHREWLLEQAAYLAKTMPRRERQVRFLNSLSLASYGFAIGLALPGIIAAAFGYHFLNGWLQFIVFTIPAIASVVGIFFADVADRHDIARYRKLDACYQKAIILNQFAQNTQEEMIIFEKLALLQTMDALEWWRSKMC